MELCCGVLLGMGESDAQRLELLEQLRELAPSEVPINFLNPRPGTPLADRPLVPAREALRWIALFRLGLPDTILRYAGGREVTLGELQEVGMRSGVNALIIGNYLTDAGAFARRRRRPARRLGMPVADGPGEGRFVVDGAGAHARPPAAVDPGAGAVGAYLSDAERRSDTHGHRTR
jgi:biotin synthase